MQVTQETHAYSGRLMSPDEVRDATSNRNSAEIPNCVRDSWYLCGDAPEQFWQMMCDEREPRGYRVSLFTTPSETAYVMFVIQLRDFQTRFLVPLIDDKSRKFIEEAGWTGVWLSIGRNGCSKALLLEFKGDPVHLRPISALAKKCRRLERDVALVELQLAAFSAIDLATIPSALAGFDVKRISLNVILPE